MFRNKEISAKILSDEGKMPLWHRIRAFSVFPFLREIHIFLRGTNKAVKNVHRQRLRHRSEWAGRKQGQSSRIIAIFYPACCTHTPGILDHHSRAAIRRLGISPVLCRALPTVRTNKTPSSRRRDRHRRSALRLLPTDGVGFQKGCSPDPVDKCPGWKNAFFSHSADR